MGLRIAELETLFTADVSRFDKGAQQVETRRKDLTGKKTEITVDADTRSALTSMDRVESTARGLPDSEFQVDADTSGASRALDGIAGEAGDAGAEAGEDAGKGLSGGIIAAIATIPIAGAIVGIGAAIGKSLLDGLQVEVRSDRLMATTGLDPVTVGKLARASGEAYANNWGESLEANMDTARLAIQGGLLDPESTARDAEAVISSLSGVADIIGGDIAAVSQATATLIRTGLVKDSQGAFDVIVRGFQLGNDKAEDWLDTLIEYPAVLSRLGLDGAEATGLINQGLEAGARNADFVADALKEFQIRATDASETSADAYALIGLSAEDMTAKIAQGGEGAREGLDQVLDGLRDMEDPVKRNEAAVGLFGTKAEDLGDALFAMDLDTVAEQLGGVEGAASSAMDALTGNAADSIATAQRNIEVAADGIKGALAAAFNPQIEQFAEYVSENRAEIMQFLLDLANGGLDAGRGFVNGLASATEGVGAFLGGPMADLLDAIGDVVLGIDAATPGDQGGQAFKEWATGAAEGLRGVEEDAGDLAETLRTELIEKGIDPAQAKLNEVGIPLVAQAALHDAAVALASDIDGVGYAADGTKSQIELLNGVVDTSTASGKLLDEQLKGVVAGLDEQTRAGFEAGESQEELRARYDEGRAALVRQLEQMGLTKAEAEKLADAYGAVPETVDTVFDAETADAQTKVNNFVNNNDGRRVRVFVDAAGGKTYRIPGSPLSFQGAGHVLQPMAMGGLDPMSPVAQTVAPNTWRVVGDRLDVDEAYIPLDGSARSWSILAEALRRMPGVSPMADGGVVGSGGGGGAVELSSRSIDNLADAILEGADRVARSRAATAAGATRSAFSTAMAGGR